VSPKEVFAQIFERQKAMAPVALSGKETIRFDAILRDQPGGTKGREYSSSTKLLPGQIKKGMKS